MCSPCSPSRSRKTWHWRTANSRPVGGNATGFAPAGNTTNGPVCRPRIHTWAMVRSASLTISMTSNASGEKAIRSQALVARKPAGPG